MSTIFGIRKLNGDQIALTDICSLGEPTLRYSSGVTSADVMGSVGMGFQPSPTHLRSQLEIHPAHDGRHTLITIDGRLDNYRELCSQLDLPGVDTPDSQIVLAAFVTWGAECFSRLIGDWAIAIWASDEDVLYLARDHAGTRSLYYENRDGSVFWSTYIETLVTDPQSRTLDSDYVACYLTMHPVRDLTPYQGVRSVLPAHYVAIRKGSTSIHRHWNWFRTSEIRYGSPEEYDERFLELLSLSVERRSGPGSPVVAQLSGGRDSSSIICVSDHYRKLRGSSDEILDSISFFDEEERGWNERPYFTAVEEHRGKAGIHIAMSFMDRSFEPHLPADGLYLFPGADSSTIERERILKNAFSAKDFRSILSGLGGDELLGGVPTALPELADYLVKGELAQLLSRAMAWCLVDRSPIFSMLCDVTKHAWQTYRPEPTNGQSLPQWLRAAVKRAHLDRLHADVTRTQRRGFTPGSIDNGIAWWAIVETLPHNFPGTLARPEYRYPYLDRDLVEFLFSIPRNQLIAPGRSRLLMRRALKGIVPEMVLERRRKSYPTLGPWRAMLKLRTKSNALLTNSIAAEMGFIDPLLLQAGIEEISEGKQTNSWQPLMRAVAFELWLRSIQSAPSFHAPMANSNEILLRNNEAFRLRAAGGSC